MKKNMIYKDNNFFNEIPLKRRIKLHIVNDHWVVIKRYFILLRKAEYYNQKKTFINRIMSLWFTRRKNRLGIKLGFYIPINTTDPGITVWHNGTVVINGDAHIGTGCIFHGNNCIGNNGKDLKAPIIGNNVELGVGASIIGGVKIANNVKIGAGAVVLSSCEEEGVTLVGIPARKISGEKK
ncbi:serine acetyltransferase [Limosilactobacillus reuteri]|uniref:Serine acetyltransferase n=1 Tax=Limosilactobacillus reuteri TaxID=1598 RepID=A0A3M6SBR4_LIMRT|nr:serine acetyltransferase [Limosilactobacillus reuteri]RMX24909.1 serine acetyltransferase [Limosilactobacillus reuteri]